VHESWTMRNLDRQWITGTRTMHIPWECCAFLRRPTEPMQVYRSSWMSIVDDNVRMFGENVDHAWVHWGSTSEALSTLSPQNSATVDSCRFRRQIVAEIGDNSRQCGQALRGRFTRTFARHVEAAGCSLQLAATKEGTEKEITVWELVHPASNHQK